MKVTQWFPMEKEPRRKGLYEVELWLEDCPKILFSYWDGRWSATSRTAFGATYLRGTPSTFRDYMLHWRGLAERPDGA